MKSSSGLLLKKHNPAKRRPVNEALVCSSSEDEILKALFNMGSLLGYDTFAHGLREVFHGRGYSDAVVHAVDTFTLALSRHVFGPESLQAADSLYHCCSVGESKDEKMLLSAIAIYDKHVFFGSYARETVYGWACCELAEIYADTGRPELGLEMLKRIEVFQEKYNLGDDHVCKTGTSCIREKCLAAQGVVEC